MCLNAETEHEFLKSDAVLRGRTVLVTCGRGQASDFAGELEAFGARVITIPLHEMVAADDYAPLDDAIDNLYGYDWIIFTGQNIVARFFRRLKQRGIGVEELDGLKICAIGTATANRLRDMEVHVDTVPMDAKTEGVFQSLTDYVGGAEQLVGLNFLLPRAASTSTELQFALEAMGARCDTVAVYQTTFPTETDRARVHALLAGGAVDCVAFESPSAVENFASLFETDDLSELLRDVRIACIGDLTDEAAKRFRLSVDIQPADFNTHSLARHIALYFTEQTEQTN